MSDCSTEAMKPKEPPRTCGNCHHCVPRHGTSFRKLDGVCLYTGNAVDTQSISHITPCGDHRMWRERKGTLEQRYKQLEQVAKELYKEAEACEIALKFTLGETPTEAERLASYAMLPYKDELEALGVSLDD